MLYMKVIPMMKIVISMFQITEFKEQEVQACLVDSSIYLAITIVILMKDLVRNNFHNI